MVRIVVTCCDAGAAANVGGPVVVTHKTFDIDNPALEAAITNDSRSYYQGFISGAEVIARAGSGG